MLACAICAVAISCNGPVSAGEPSMDRYLVRLPTGAKARLGMLLQKSPGDPAFVRRAPTISPDGKLAACGIEKNVVVWDIATGRVVRNIAAFPKRVGAAVFADNNTILAIDSTIGDQGPRAKNSVKSWDIHTSKVLRSFEIAETNDAVFSHDSKLVVTTWGDKIDAWDTQTGKKLFSDKERNPHVFFTPNDRYIVTCRPDKIEQRFVRIMTFRDAQTGKVTRSFELKDANAVVAISPDEKLLLAHTPNRDDPTKSFSSYRLQLLEAQTGKVVHTLTDRSTGELKGYVYSPDGRLVAGFDGKVGAYCTWDVETGMKTATFQSKESATYPAFTTNGKTLVHVTPAGRVFADDIATGVMRDFNPTQESRILAFAFSADGKRLASTSSPTFGGSEIILWDIANAIASSRFKTSVVRKTPRTYYDPVLKMAFAPDDKYLLAQHGDDSVRLYAPSQGREVLSFRNAGNFWGFTDNGKHLHWTPTSLEPQDALYPRKPQRVPDDIDKWLGAARWMASAAVFPELQQFRCRTYAPSKLTDKSLRASNISRRTDGDVTPFNLSPDGSVLVELLFRSTGEFMSPWERHGYRFCDAGTGKELVRIPRKADDDLLWFAPDSRSFVSLVTNDGEEDSTYSLTLFETRTGQERHRICDSRYAFFASHRAFSRDGRWLAIGRVKTIEIFDLAFGVKAATLPHQDEFPCIAFSPDGKLLATGGNSRTILLWDMTAFVKQEFYEAPWAAIDRDRMWNDLAHADAAKAFAAMMRMKRNPSAAVALMRDRLRWRMPKVDLSKVIEQVISGDFATRQKATDIVEQIGDRAYPALVEALPRTKSLEDRRRLETLLARCERPFTMPERLRLLRSIEVLDALRTTDAAALLRDIAADAAGDEPLQREVARALERARVHQ